MEILDLVMVLTHLKVDWRCALTMPGEQSVTTASAHLTQRPCAHSWATDSMGHKYYQYLSFHKALVLYSLMSWHVVEMNRVFWNVVEVLLDFIPAHTSRMLLSDA